MASNHAAYCLMRLRSVAMSISSVFCRIETAKSSHCWAAPELEGGSNWCPARHGAARLEGAPQTEDPVVCPQNAHSMQNACGCAVSVATCWKRVNSAATSGTSAFLSGGSSRTSLAKHARRKSRNGCFSASGRSFHRGTLRSSFSLLRALCD